MSETPRVLIVDDSALNRQILKKVLQKDYELEEAVDGPSALEKMHTFAPDLVLLDIMMPGMSGYEVCQKIKSGPCGAFTQVILVSGKASSAERLKGYEALADDYVIKPFDHDEMLSKVKVHFRLRHAQHQVWHANSIIANHNERLEQLVAERTKEVIATQDVAVFALAELAETRDPETGEHLYRMRAYAQRLAEELAHDSPYADQIDARFLADLYRSSPLHDIGKVGVPDAILQKPGKLTAAEFELMKRHVEIGAATLARAAKHVGSGQFLTMAAEIAKYHHERFNGRGYLLGIKGLDIPLSARIVAVADVYDALTTVRVYKPAMEANEARTLIVGESGEHFDPAIVAAFERSFEDFQDIRQSLNTEFSQTEPVMLNA
jgi:putative two-component system response regulator